jgi:release factor glutamine methyltransferase
MVTVDELLRQAQDELEASSFRPPRREARLLLSTVLGWNEAKVMSRGEATVPPPAASRFTQLLDRRLTGEPIAYLLGEKEFFGRSFFVDSRVLVPRPETEHLIEAVLEKFDTSAPRVLDLGTGSGCIAVTIAAEVPGARVVAVDNSIGALAIARRNIALHSVGDRVSIISSDLATALEVASFDLVVSNPPYVDPDDDRLVTREVVDFEPSTALFAADSGEAIVRRMLTDLARLDSGTPLCFEMGAGQAPSLTRAISSSPFQLLEIKPDLAGIPRIMIARRR